MHIYSIAAGHAAHTLTWDVSIDIDAGYDRDTLAFTITLPAMGWVSILESIVRAIAPNHIGYQWMPHGVPERAIVLDDEF